MVDVFATDSSTTDLDRILYFDALKPFMWYVILASNPISNYWNFTTGVKERS